MFEACYWKLYCQIGEIGQLGQPNKSGSVSDSSDTLWITSPPFNYGCDQYVKALSFVDFVSNPLIHYYSTELQSNTFSFTLGVS